MSRVDDWGPLNDLVHGREAPVEAPGEPVEVPGCRVDGYLPIEAYAAIGDGRTLVLVGVDGSIDWMCLPDLDAPSVFAALLDFGRGGRFLLSPAVPFTVHRAYLERTNVLQSTFRTAAGVVRVTDALTLSEGQNAPWRELVRRTEGVSGAVPMCWRFEPRFDYGAVGATFIGLPEGATLTRHGQLQIALQNWDGGLTEETDGALSGHFVVEPGDTALLAMQASNGESLPIPPRGEVERRLEQTGTVWRSWVARHTYAGPWTEAVERSLLAIRLLADGRTGAITAAGTTSLPEALGAERNFDYRFGWTRDLSFTLDALERMGMSQLSEASFTWLLGSTRHTAPRVDPVYGLTGNTVRGQQQLPLHGYRGTGPVRLGNDAGSQLQLGGFGDLLDAAHGHVLSGHVLSASAGERLADMVDLLCSLWGCRDSGLWELGETAQYTTSKVGCWLAFDRALSLAQMGQIPSRHLERWERGREEVESFIETRLWSQEKRSYVMKEGSEALDCGCLLAARRGYGDPHGERLNGTIDALRRELHAEGPLFYRYTGMREQENAFLACSFWMVEALALAGRRAEATDLMREAVAVASDVGLLSEEMEPGTRAMRGNLPQALSHLSLITAASLLSLPESDGEGDGGHRAQALDRTG